MKNRQSARSQRRVSTTIAGALALTVVCTIAAPAQAAPGDTITPTPDARGRHYVDEAWATNSTANTTPATNAAIGVLTPMLSYWTPEAPATPEYDANGEFLPDSVGTVINPTFHNANIAESARITRTRTPEQADAAYVYDRRNQNYSAIQGFGP